MTAATVNKCFIAASLREVDCFSSSMRVGGSHGIMTKVVGRYCAGGDKSVTDGQAARGTADGACSDLRQGDRSWIDSPVSGRMYNAPLRLEKGAMKRDMPTYGRSVFGESAIKKAAEEGELGVRSVVGHRKECGCGGSNPDCPKCYGSGYYVPAHGKARKTRLSKKKH